MNYVLFDARAALGDPDDATVLLAGSAEECCEAANTGEYGEGCVVANQNSEIMWAWFHTGKWVPIK